MVERLAADQPAPIGLRARERAERSGGVLRIDSHQGRQFDVPPQTDIERRRAQRRIGPIASEDVARFRARAAMPATDGPSPAMEKVGDASSQHSERGRIRRGARRRLEQHACMTLGAKFRQRGQPGDSIHRQSQRPEAHRPADQLQMRHKPAPLPHEQPIRGLVGRIVLRRVELFARRALEHGQEQLINIWMIAGPTEDHLRRIRPGRLARNCSRGTLTARRDWRGLARPEETRFGRRSGIPATRPNPRRRGRSFVDWIRRRTIGGWTTFRILEPLDRRGVSGRCLLSLRDNRRTYGVAHAESLLRWTSILLISHER